MKRWQGIAAAVGIFAIARGAVDLADQRYVWGAIGLLGGLTLLLTPIRTRALKLDVIDPADPRPGP